MQADNNARFSVFNQKNAKTNDWAGHVSHDSKKMNPSKTDKTKKKSGGYTDGL